jgi:hypothetical protein
MGQAQLTGRGALKFGYRLAENELLRLKHAVQGFEELVVNGVILTLEIQHGDRLGLRG